MNNYPDRLRLIDDNAVHVWQVKLDSPHVVATVSREILDESERARANRYVREQPRREFVAFRSVLRDLLSSYLAIDARDVAFEYGANGKPTLAKTHASPLVFNLSHSAGVALLAIGRKYSLGVDIEAHRDRIDVDGIIERYFCASERAFLSDAHGLERRTRFYRAWALKEAVMKCTGLGMALPSNSFCLNLRDTEGPVSIDDVGTGYEYVKACSLQELAAPRGYSAALAVANAPTPPAIRRYSF